MIYVSTINHKSKIINLQSSFRARQFKPVDIASDGHLDGTGQSLEDTFDLVVFVRAFRFYVQVHAGSIAQALKEMQEQLGRHIPYFLTVELRIPNQPRTSAEIKRHTAQAIVHRQTVTVAFDPSLIAQSL